MPEASFRLMRDCRAAVEGRWLVAVLVAALFAGSCSDSPSQPGPVPPPAPIPSPNQPPVIESIVVSTQRVEVDAEVTVTAVVRDAETAVEQLTFEWTAEGGTFTGEGPRVNWKAPADQATPRDHAVTLTVTETFGTALNGGARPQHRVTSTSPVVRVHNSPKELGDMGVAFLRKFGDSSVSPEACVVDFSDTCRGKREELADIALNRKHYRILSASIGTPRVRYVPGSNAAEVVIRASYNSRVISCDDWPWQGPCNLNRVGSVTFDGRLPGVYEQGRWWLCESRAEEVPGSPISPMMRPFLGLSGRR